MNPPHDAIDLWICFCDEIQNPELLSRYHGLLESHEQEQQQRFYFARHRHQYLVTRALVRSVLSLYTDISPEDWRFTKNQYGRPEIEKGLIEFPLRFNLSHTDGMVICGVTMKEDIGVDVENIDRKNDGIKIADRYFSPSEVSELNSQPEENQRQRFFDYWTLKESYIKAKGMGLSLPLDQFSFHIPEDKPIEISFDPRLNDDPEMWQFWRLKASEQHRIAIGIKSPKTLRITPRKIIPLYDWSDFYAVML